MVESSIYTGIWINWSKGPILGATLTTTSKDGFLLASFLALFVRMVGSHFWSVLCFVIHQLYGTIIDFMRILQALSSHSPRLLKSRVDSKQYTCTKSIFLITSSDALAQEVQPSQDRLPLWPHICGPNIRR